MWDRERRGIVFNPDNEEHIEWVYQQSLERSRKFNIDGVTKFLTKGVVKRIIPAVASTNALIASVLVNEAFKIATYSNPVMNNYLMYMGQTGINSQTFSYEQRDDCLVCQRSGNGRTVPLFIEDRQSTVGDILEILISKLRLEKPSISYRPTGEIVFMQSPPALRALHEHKLEIPIRHVIQQFEGDIELIVTDTALSSHILVNLTNS
jgi:ubiquitin-activating enzyme E1 C